MLVAFREVETTLANEQLIARRLTYEETALGDAREAVRIAMFQYQAGRRDFLWVSNLQTDEIAIEAGVIRARNLQRTNRIRLFLALGGSFDATPAVD